MISFALRLFSPRFLLLCGLAAATAACQTYALVPVERVTLINGVSAEPSVNWNKRVWEKEEHWTIDGERLQKITFLGAIKNGEALFTFTDKEKQKDMPEFRSDMSLLELRDFFESSIRQTGPSQFETLSFAPAKFSNHDGFRVEFRYNNKQGTKKLGFAVGANIAGKLYLALYHGTKLHYYDKYLKEAETIIQSLKLADRGLTLSMRRVGVPTIFNTRRFRSNNAAFSESYRKRARISSIRRRSTPES